MVTGIIAEYNPFHNGHKVQIDYARNTLKSDYIVVALSPDFTQRGEVALLSKYERAKIALELGVDLVVQIPINSATDSSLGYAYGGIKVLASLGIIDTILFSVEDDDISLFERIASIELDENEYYIETINKSLKEGLNYPSAREKAIMHMVPDINSDLLHNILKQPNNILAIEYLKSLKILNSSIKPICMKRLIASYHDTAISNRIASATSIRHAIYNDSFSDIEKAVPEVAFSTYKKIQENRQFLYPDDVSQMLGYKLLDGNLTNYKDCNDELAYKIGNAINNFISYSQFKGLLKSKNITESRISRVLCHILLNLTNDLYKEIEGKIYPYIPYIYILGFNNNGSKLMSDIKENSTLPYFTSYNDALEYSFKESSYDNSSVLKLISTDINATKIYNIILANKTNKEVTSELSRKFLVV